MLELVVIVTLFAVMIVVGIVITVLGVCRQVRRYTTAKEKF